MENTPKFFRVKNWEQYQHYRDRNPPWIKLHRSLFRSPLWLNASDSNRVLMVGLMNLAAETGNLIPNDPSCVRKALALNSRPDFTYLLDNEFLCYHDASNTLAECLQTTPTNASKVLAKRYTRDRDRDREEKEESICSEPEILPSTESEEELSEFSLPCVGKGPPNFPITVRMLRLWENAYPSVDITSEIPKMIVWLESNTNNRKTYRGMKRFINSWLSRAQDKPKAGGSNGTYLSRAEQAKEQTRRSFESLGLSVGGEFVDRDS